MTAVLLTLAFLAFIAWRERTAARERAELIQRLQAPQQAVAAYGRDKGKKRHRARVLVSDDNAQAEAIKRREREASNGNGN